MRRMIQNGTVVQQLIVKWLGVLSAAFLFVTAVWAASTPDELITRKVEKLDTDLFVSATSHLPEEIRKSGIQLVDVRSPESFYELHIPGSINIPLHFIRTKPWLMTSPLVLVDQGLSTHGLVPVCENLRKKGVDIRILDGGLVAWKRNGGKILGNVTRIGEFAKISPKAFFMETKTRSRVVCDVSVSRSKISIRLLPDAVHLPLFGNEKIRLEMAEKFQKLHSRNGTSTIIVLNNDGEGYRGVNALLTRVGCKNVFYLHGGLNAYEKHLNGLIQSWRSPEDRLMSEKPCRKCMESY